MKYYYVYSSYHNYSKIVISKLILSGLLCLISYNDFSQNYKLFDDPKVFLERIELEINSINDQSSLKEYWLNIDTQDQSKRGRNSSIKNDLFNAYRVYLLLAKFGYPTVKEFGSFINSIPYYVNVHQGFRIGNINTRRFLFPYFYKAWKTYNLSEQMMQSIVCGLPCEFSRKLLMGERLPEESEILKIIEECQLPTEPINNDSIKDVILEIIEDYSHNFKDFTVGVWKLNKYKNWIIKIRDNEIFLMEINTDSSFTKYKLIESKIGDEVKYNFEFYHYDDYIIIDKNNKLFLCNDRTGKKQNLAKLK